MFDVVLEFPKMKVAVLTREERVVEIRYLPPGAPSVAPKNPLADEARKQLARYRAEQWATQRSVADIAASTQAVLTAHVTPANHPAVGAGIPEHTHEPGKVAR